MRVLPPALVVLIACCAPPHAVAAPVKPATKSAAKPGRASPTPAPAKGFYAGIPDAERLAIQSDLIWTGDYNGVVGAEFGDRAIAAVQAFQKRNGGKDTGILNPEERAKLAQAARTRQEQAGWRIVDDPATGARLGIPQKLAPQAAKAATGSHWQSVHGEVQVETFRVAAAGTTLAGVFEQQRKQPAERKVEYNVLRPDFFVLSGMQNLKKFYVRGQVKDNEVRGLTILYDQALEGTWDRIAVAMSSAFAAFPAQTASPAAASRRKVEYGTGLVVSPTGDIVTDGDLLAGCEFVVVPGFGHAERVAEEKGLALLRLNGASHLASIALGNGGPPPAGDITFVGIADPQAQNGGTTVSIARGRVAANGGAIDPAPGAGFAGAAALDRDGNVAGMVGARAASAAAGAQVVPAQAITQFLEAQRIAPTAGRGGLDGVKAATVRVICVRK
jgi:putative peptidoglycan binding protein